MQHPVDPPYHRVDACRVVGIEMREDQQVDVRDAGAREAGRQRTRVGAGVDEGDLAGRADEQRITLADIAREDRPFGREGERACQPERTAPPARRRRR